MILTAIFYPGVNLSMTAQTRESACGLIEDKFHEIMSFYPLLAECVEHFSFTKDKAVVIFKNGSRITNLANHQSSKGKDLLPSHTFSRRWRGLSIIRQLTRKTQRVMAVLISWQDLIFFR